MFFLDIETLGVESTAAILSIAIIHVPDAEPRPAVELMSDYIFVKFDVKDQISRFKRTVDMGTISWWKKQSDLARNKSYERNPELDLSSEEALDRIDAWAKKHKDYSTDLVWIRGTLDQMAVDSLYSALKRNPPFNYDVYRDMRTAVDLLYPNSNGGYVEVDSSVCIGYDQLQWVKHDPVHDVTIDAAMLLYGKK